MIRTIAACAAAVAMCGAVVSHLTGFEAVAEACGSIAFASLVFAVAVPAKRDDPGDGSR